MGTVVYHPLLILYDHIVFTVRLAIIFLSASTTSGFNLCEYVCKIGSPFPVENGVANQKGIVQLSPRKTLVIIVHPVSSYIIIVTESLLCHQRGFLYTEQYSESSSEIHYIYLQIYHLQRLYAKQDEVFIGTHLKSQVNAIFCCANSKKHQM